MSLLETRKHSLSEGVKPVARALIATLIELAVVTLLLFVNGVLQGEDPI